ncbi:sugar transferase [Thermophilibacter provencensis]|uniref:sugar transferase n=1 Tax=Thermophilibacter provencensis TaxID=1852386 RepID=UPI00094B27D3|nr:sugar transferase [Thermophilibacter provencensis]
MDRNELVVTQCGGYALERVEGVAAGLDPEAARAAGRLRTGRWAYRAVKRAFDVCFSACVLVCLSWLFLIVAIAIKLDDPEGPVIFSQARVGRDGREFRMYKFRSMCADAESRLAELAGRNEKDGPVFKMADDPRVTRVGRFLRKTRLTPVIIGTPGDGEPTKSLSHLENSSLDLQKCERRPGTSLGAHHHYTSLQFLSFTVFGGPEGASGRSLCAFAQTPFASVGTAA